jgi:RNA polymerase sigma factor (sigma-70 family)
MTRLTATHPPAILGDAMASPAGVDFARAAAADRAATPPPPLPPAELIALFEQAVRLHTRRLLAIARAIAGHRASAEDVLQQALTNLFQHRARYDWANPAAAGALMRRAVVNEALRLLRQPRMAVVGDEQPDDRGPRGRRASGADPLVDRETIDRVRAAIGKLPEHFRAALVLCEYEGMSYVQIAEVLHCSIPQVKTWLHRARRQLARMLEASDGAGEDAGRG